MKKIIIFYLLFILFLGGCFEKVPPEPPTQDIKITDLAPVSSNGIKGNLNTMNFDIIIFEIPENNIDLLKDIWQNLYTKPIEFENMFASKANSFKISFGEVQMWPKVGQILNDIKAEKYNQYRYLLTIEHSENMPIKKLVKPADIFYYGPNLSQKILKKQQGRIVLNVKPDKPLGSRGVCKLSITPALLLDGSENNQGNPFEHLGFTAKMTPGDFMIMAPGKNYKQQDSLSSFFFHRNIIKPKTLIYVVFCLGIDD